MHSIYSIIRIEYCDRRGNIEQKSIKDKPEGFSEYFTIKLAECVARGIVEKSIRNIHNRESADQIKDETNEKKPP